MYLLGISIDIKVLHKLLFMLLTSTIMSCGKMAVGDHRKQGRELTDYSANPNLMSPGSGASSECERGGVDKPSKGRRVCVWGAGLSQRT